MNKTERGQGPASSCRILTYGIPMRFTIPPNPAAGGTFALYSLLCRNMGIRPHGARGAHAALIATGGAGGAAALEGTAAAGAAAAAAEGPAGLGAQVHARHGSAVQSEQRQWWQRWAADRRRVHAFFRSSRRGQVGRGGARRIAAGLSRRTAPRQLALLVAAWLRVGGEAGRLVHLTARAWPCHLPGRRRGI